MLGKAKCKILKEIRQKIADENDIPYVTRECTYQGDCSGTCPRCESELRYLERELEARRRIGKQVAVTALCTGISLGTVGCSVPGQELGGATELPRGKYEEELEGEPIELSGDVEVLPGGEGELEGDVPDYGGGEYEGEAIELSGDVDYGGEELAGEVEDWDGCGTGSASGDITKTADNAFEGLVSFAGTFNNKAVLSGARHCPLFKPDKDVRLSALTTYHWNGGLGAAPGVIRIYDITGDEEELLGTWEATARDGSGAENVNWDIFPDIMLQAGHTYHIIDSDPATWSNNESSEDIGFVELFTDEETGTGGEFMPCSGH